MRTLALLLLSSCVGAALAQQNPFNIPDGGYSGVTAGNSLDLSWSPTTGGTVTLVLRSGDSSDLAAGTEIVANAPNNGHYTWSVPGSITKGFAYTIQIISDHGDLNYTPYFAIDSTNTAPSSTSIVATGAPTGGGAALPPVPSSLQAAQSSVVAAAPMSSAAASSGVASSMASATGSMASASSMGGASGATASATGASAAASAQATGRAVRPVVAQGVLAAGVVGAVGWVV